jgi:branched-chain amino acid transport system substrate-binding protein
MPEPVKIGSAMSTSGSFAALKLPHLRGAEMAVADVNREGGIYYGGDFHPVRLINYDSASDLLTCVENVRRLVHEDRVDFMINLDVTSDQALASQPITEAAAVPLLHIGLARKLIGPHAYYTFRDVLSVRERTPILCAYLRDKMPLCRTISVIDTDTELGREHLAAVRETAPRYGFQVTSALLYDPAEADYDALIARALKDHPDVFDHGAGANNALDRIILALSGQGYRGLVVSSNDYPTAPEVSQRLGIGGEALMEGYLQFGIDDRAAEYPATLRRLRQRALETGGIYTSGTATLYEKVRWIKQGVEGCGTTDADTFVRWLEQNPLETDYGPARFGGASVYGINRQLEGYFGLVQFVGGARRQVHFGKFSFDD